MILKSSRLFILINGSPHNYIPCERGVRQGYPLSPLLFCIAKDVLRRSILKLRQKGDLKYISSPRGVTAPSYSFYADDLIIFCRVKMKGVCALMNLFDAYGECSGQVNSKEMSNIFLGKTIIRSREILEEMDITQGHLPFRYLDVPIFNGVSKGEYFTKIVDRMRAKLATWKGIYFLWREGCR